MTLTQWRLARMAAFRIGRYRVAAPPVCSVRWTDRDWMNAALFSDPRLNGFDDGRPDTPPAKPESCDDLSLDSVAGVAQALGLGIDEARRLLAAHQPEDWQ